MKKIRILILLSFIFICSGCPDKCENCHQYIVLINKSDENIICEFQRRKIEEKDTSLCVIHWDRIGLSIKGNSLGSIPCGNIDRNCNWETGLNTNYYVQLLTINDSIYQYYIDLFGFNNDSIQKYVPILNCYQLTLEDLQRMNWTVVYPPED